MSKKTAECPKRKLCAHQISSRLRLVKFIIFTRVRPKEREREPANLRSLEMSPTLETLQSQDQAFEFSVSPRTASASNLLTSANVQVRQLRAVSATNGRYKRPTRKFRVLAEDVPSHPSIGPLFRFTSLSRASDFIDETLQSTAVDGEKEEADKGGERQRRLRRSRGEMILLPGTCHLRENRKSWSTRHVGDKGNGCSAR